MDAQHIHLALHIVTTLHQLGSIVAAGPSPTPGAGGSGGGINTGNPSQLLPFFSAWSDAAKQWAPFIMIFGVIMAYLILSIGHQRGWGHIKDVLAGGVAVMVVIALAPALFA